MRAMARRFLGDKPLPESAIFKPRPGSYGFHLCFPWLTTDPTWRAQGWSETPKAITDDDMVRAFGERARGAKFAEIDKTAVRLTVEIPDNEVHVKLVHWSEFAAAWQVADWFYAALDNAGDGGSDNWWVHRGVIPPSHIIAVEFRPAAPTATNV